MAGLDCDPTYAPGKPVCFTEPTLNDLLAGFAITLRALLLQQVVINTMTMLNVTEKLEAIEQLLKEK